MHKTVEIGGGGGMPRMRADTKGNFFSPTPPPPQQQLTSDDVRKAGTI